MLQRTRLSLRHYEELLHGTSPCGVYAITFRDCRKMYIGSSKKIPTRLKEHISKLQQNIHWCPKLQRAFNSYGEELLQLVLLERCRQEETKEVEQLWLSCNAKFLFNKVPFAEPLRAPRTVQHTLAISRATKGVAKPTRGKTFMEIYGTDSPACGFQTGDSNVAKRPEIRRKISAAITEWHKRGRSNA